MAKRLADGNIAAFVTAQLVAALPATVFSIGCWQKNRL